MWHPVQARYEGETFVRVLPKGQVPHTRYVRGSNYQHIAVFEDRLPGRAIIVSGWRRFPCFHGSGRLSELLVGQASDTMSPVVQFWTT